MWSWEFLCSVMHMFLGVYKNECLISKLKPFQSLLQMPIFSPSFGSDASVLVLQGPHAVTSNKRCFSIIHPCRVLYFGLSFHVLPL